MKKLNVIDALVNGNKEKLKTICTMLEENFDTSIEEIFIYISTTITSYEIEEHEVFNCLKNLNYILKSNLDSHKLSIIISKYEKLLQCFPKDSKYYNFINSTINKCKNKKQEVNNLVAYETLKYIIFELKDINIIKKLLNDYKSIIYDKACNNILYDIIKTYLSTNKDEFYYKQIINSMLYRKEVFINKDNKSKIYDLLKTNKKNKKSKEIECILDENELKLNKLGIKNRNNLSIDYKFTKEGRYDFTDQYVISIDGEESICLDDAISLVSNKDGTNTLYIHITDIYDILKNNTEVDKYAYELGETLYLYDQAYPMLPFEISYDIGSLLHNQMRNSITFVVKLDNNYDFIGSNITDYFSIVKGTIINKASLAYQPVDDILKRGCTNPKLQQMLINLSQIASKLHNDNPNKDIYYQAQNIKNKEIGLSTPVESNYTNIYTGARIVEELMVLINRLCPEYFNKLDYPFLYRICENEVASNKDNLKNLLDNFITTRNIAHKKIKYNTIMSYFSDFLAEAKYSPENKGHIGVKCDYYAHVTCPARRYADIINQKLIYDIMFNKNTNLYSLNLWHNRLEQIARHLNERSKINEDIATQYYHTKQRKK